MWKSETNSHKTIKSSFIKDVLKNIIFDVSLPSLSKKHKGIKEFLIKAVQNLEIYGKYGNFLRTAQNEIYWKDLCIFLHKKALYFNVELSQEIKLR